MSASEDRWSNVGGNGGVSQKVARSVAVAVGLLAASCGGGREPDFYVHETGVVVASDVPFASRRDLPARLESTVAAALAYWGGDWRALRGRTITLSGAARVTCAGGEPSLGCYDGTIRVTTSDPGLGPWACVEQTVLVHEVGHAVLGDPLHEDPRWMQLEPVGDALAGRTGYTATGEVGCTIYLSVWRHPLGSP